MSQNLLVCFSRQLLLVISTNGAMQEVPFMVAKYRAHSGIVPAGILPLFSHKCKRTYTGGRAGEAYALLFSENNISSSFYSAEFFLFLSGIFRDFVTVQLASEIV